MNVFGCVGHTFLLRSGRYFDLDKPDPKLICLSDIAASLSKICRFGGHTPKHYSVAEHSLLAAKEAFISGHCAEECRAVMLHDAVGAYVGDMIKPLKMLVGYAYADVEKNVEAAVGTAFNVDFTKHAKVIKKFDQAMLIAEKRFFFSHDRVKWYGEDEATQVSPMFCCYDWDEAETLFIKCYTRLTDLSG